MPGYSVYGRLGTGKGKFCVWRAREGLREGRRVAANFELRLSALVPELPASYVRLPHKPSAADLHAMGHGNPDSYDEDKNGLLFLDECGTWLNSRTFQDKGRGDIIDWFIHARKLGWDPYVIVQDPQMIDKQLRKSVIEHDVRLVRMDKVRVPFVGRVMGLLGGKKAGYFPRLHIATARMEITAGQSVVSDRWMFRGDDLEASYDTREVFVEHDDFGPHSVLPPWDFKRPLSLADKLAQSWRAACAPPVRPPLRPKHPRVATAARVLPPSEAWDYARGAVSRGLL